MYPSFPSDSVGHAENSQLTRADTIQLDHDAEFWLEDGNIILVARNVAFRVYRGLLASQSPVFSGMLAASSSTAEETYADCPIVHLSDSPEDLRHFLRVLLPKSGRSFDGGAPRPKLAFDQVHAIVRLSHKYQVDDAYQQAMSHFVSYYTQHYDSWTHPIIDPWGPSHGTCAIGAVNLARLTDTPSILRRAMFQCAALGIFLLDGWMREDGTIEHLSREDVRQCMDVRHMLDQRAFAVMAHVFNPNTPSPGCTQPEVCRNEITRALTGFLEEVSLEDVVMIAILMSWKLRIEDMAEAGVERSICHACESAMVDRDVAERRKIWEELPTLFKIER